MGMLDLGEEQRHQVTRDIGARDLIPGPPTRRFHMAYPSVLTPRIEIHECVFRPWAGMPNREIGWGVGWYVVPVDSPGMFPDPVDPDVLGGERSSVVSELVIHCCLPVCEGNHLTYGEPPPGPTYGFDCFKRSVWVGEHAWDVKVSVEHGRTFRGPLMEGRDIPILELLRTRLIAHSIESRGPITGIVRKPSALSPNQHDLLVLAAMAHEGRSYPECHARMDAAGCEAKVTQDGVGFIHVDGTSTGVRCTMISAIEKAVEIVHGG